jgi:UDP-N-acetylmuramate--alanine ligase
MEEFGTAFADADSLLVLDIYAASEQPIDGITSEGLVSAIQQLGNKDARYVASFDQAAHLLASETNSGDMILTLGAGSVSQLGPEILERLKGRRKSA